MDGCLSGLKEQFTKLSDSKESRGFESLPIRKRKIPKGIFSFAEDEQTKLL